MRSIESSKKIRKELIEVSLYIEAHCRENLNWQLIGSEIGLSGDYLKRLYAKSTHTTLREETRSYRLANAAKRLRETDDSIAEIGYGENIGTPSYFSRSFREKYGMSPREYRAIHGENTDLSER